MSCYVEGCKKELEFLCEECEIKIYLCFSHSKTHKKDADHGPRYLNSREIEFIGILKDCIHEHIVYIQKCTSMVIYALENACRRAIKNLKHKNRNIVNASDFIASTFTEEMIRFLISQTGIISGDITISPECEIKKLLDESKSLNQQIDDLNQLINQKNSNIKDLNSRLAQKDSTIKDLNSRLAKKDSKIEDLNSCLAQKDLKIKSLNNNIDLRKLAETYGHIIRGFNQMGLQERVKLGGFMIDSSIFGDWTNDIIISDSGSFLFHCIKYIGMRKQDCNL